MANSVVTTVSVRQLADMYPGEWFLLRTTNKVRGVKYMDMEGELLFHHPKRSRVEAFSLKEIDANPAEAHRLLLDEAVHWITSGAELSTAIEALKEEGASFDSRRW
jgi:hypothetical protein